MIVWIAALFLLRNGYFLSFELGPRGATPGKRLAGIRVAARDGGRLSAETVIARNLLRDIELFLPLLFLSALRRRRRDRRGRAGGGGLVPGVRAVAVASTATACAPATWSPEAGWSRRRARRLGAGDVARRRSRGAGAYRFGEAELSVYGEHELQMLERVLRENRPRGARRGARDDLPARSAGTGGGRGGAFLEAYYRQLRARLEAGMRFGRRKRDKYA